MRVGALRKQCLDFISFSTSDSLINLGKIGELVSHMDIFYFPFYGEPINV